MSTESPYRTVAVSPVRTKPPAELNVHSSDLEAHRGASAVMFRTMLLAVVPSLLVAYAGAPNAGVTLMLAAFAIGIVRWRTSRDVAGVVLRVGGGELSVARRRDGNVLFALPLRSVVDVRLDTKEIRKLRRSTSLGSATIGSDVDGVIDVSRIALIPLAPREPFFLTEAHVAHTEAVETAGAVRRFLRAHGWLPTDERKSPRA